MLYFTSALCRYYGHMSTIIEVFFYFTDSFCDISPIFNRKLKSMSSSAKDSHYARLRRQHREQKQASETKSYVTSPEKIYIYGMHSVIAALNNPRRLLHKLYLTPNAQNRLEAQLANIKCEIELVKPSELAKLLGDSATHQGIALLTNPLKPKKLPQLSDSNLVVILDQITDPHNVGAIMRSAVAMGAKAIITTTRHSPTETGVLAKSASGALELIEHIAVTNLSNAILELHKLGFTSYGLDSEGAQPLETVFSGSKIALVLGAEGKGLRQKTRETVTNFACLDMVGPIKSLNVSNAAAIALYSAQQYLQKHIIE